MSTSLIAKFETARLIPLDDTAKLLDGLYGSGTLIQENAREARSTAPPDWFQPWPDYEARAVSLRWYEPTFVPGPLQTEQYAREVLAAGLLTPDEAEERLALRLERQAVALGGDRPPIATFIVDEFALMRGEPATLKEQLDHLVELSKQPRVFIHVVPRTAGLYVGQSGNFIVASLPGGVDVAYLEDQLSGKVVTDLDLIAKAVRAWDAIRSVALPRDMSRDLIQRMADEL